MNDMLAIQNLCKKYAGFELKDVSFSVPEGYIMGFIGPNGAGKTTTIKALLGMVVPDTGEIEIMGRRVLTDKSIMEEIGVVMDLPFYVDDWRVEDTEKAISPFYEKWDSRIFAQYIDRFDIDKKKKVKELSRGMKVKLMIAAALSHGARLLILDEPTSGLDPVARDELMEILSEFIVNGRNSVLFSTHITSDLEKIADYITFIYKGKIQFSGEKDELLDRYRLVKGEAGKLSLAERNLIIGYHEYSVGFDGMVSRKDLKKLSVDIVHEPITLDEIIVYMNREERKYE